MRIDVLYAFCHSPSIPPQPIHGLSEAVPDSSSSPKPPAAMSKQPPEQHSFKASFQFSTGGGANASWSVILSACPAPADRNGGADEASTAAASDGPIPTSATDKVATSSDDESDVESDVESGVESNAAYDAESDVESDAESEDESKAVTLGNATHVFYGGALYPLLRDAGGSCFILAPEYTKITPKKTLGLGSQLLRLAPCSTDHERLEQLKSLGAVAADDCDLEWSFGEDVLKGGLRKHVILPDGDVLPVFMKTCCDYAISVPSKVSPSGKVRSVEWREVEEMVGDDSRL